MAYKIFLKFYLKLESFKCQKLKELYYSEKFSFLRRSAAICQDFLAFDKNLIY